jgi:glycosyltransferase involved in cell wall biosynthesis
VSMTDDKPLVSIGVPVHNGETYIRRTLDSLLSQDYENVELIISDNASTDSTQQICLEYAKREDKVRYHRNKVNLGSVRNFNTLFEFSYGKYFMWAGAHDLWEPSFISSCIEVLENDPSVVLCYSHTGWIDINDKLLEDIPFRLDTRGLDKVSRFHVVMWAYYNNSYIIYGLIRSEALKRTRLFGNTVAPDAILLTELSLLGAFAHVPELLFYLRKTQGWGDWYVVLDKINKRLPTRWPAQHAYRELVRDHLRIIVRNLRSEGGSYTEQAIIMLSAFLGGIRRYLWILRGISASNR